MKASGMGVLNTPHYFAGRIQIADPVLNHNEKSESHLPQYHSLAEVESYFQSSLKKKGIN